MKQQWLLHLSTMAMQHQQQRQVVMKSNSQFVFDAHNHIHLSLQSERNSEVREHEQAERQENENGYSIPPLSFEGNNVLSDCLPVDVRKDVKNHANAVLESFYNDDSTIEGEEDKEDCSESKGAPTNKLIVQGVAIMSTQPRDFPIVEQLVRNLQDSDEKVPHAIPCFGVHPWFLKEANEEFYQLNEFKADDNSDSSLLELIGAIHYETNNSEKIQISSWLPYLHDTIISNPNSHVGEIGLDNARWDDPETKELVCPMEIQIQAFEIQLHLAAHLEKAVSIHSVRSWGILMDTLRKVKKQRQQLKKKLKKEKKNVSSFLVLPPRLYFHAFGGNSSIVDQINSICCKETTSKTFFGFAPVINFRSPKTADTIRKVGIKSLVLESDLEDYSGVPNDLKLNVAFTADALGLDVGEVSTITNENAKRLYNIVDAE